MAFIDVPRLETERTRDAAIGEAGGLALSALLPLVAATAVSLMAAVAGLGETIPLLAEPVAMLFYLPLFALWGAAHWLASRAGGIGASRWVLAVIGWGLVYPFLPAVADAFWLGWINLFSLLLVGTAALKVAPVSRVALLLMVPSLVWVALAAIPGYVLVTNGWSPGFAVTIGTLGEGSSD